ncbi:hypothetical protein Csa_024002, partial [Cucumis sativus]
ASVAGKSSEPLYAKISSGFQRQLCYWCLIFLGQNCLQLLTTPVRLNNPKSSINGEIMKMFECSEVTTVKQRALTGLNVCTTWLSKIGE